MKESRKKNGGHEEPEDHKQNKELNGWEERLWKRKREEVSNFLKLAAY